MSTGPGPELIQFAETGPRHNLLSNLSWQWAPVGQPSLNWCQTDGLTAATKSLHPPRLWWDRINRHNLEKPPAALFLPPRRQGDPKITGAPSTRGGGTSGLKMPAGHLRPWLRSKSYPGQGGCIASLTPPPLMAGERTTPFLSDPSLFSPLISLPLVWLTPPSTLNRQSPIKLLITLIWHPLLFGAPTGVADADEAYRVPPVSARRAHLLGQAPVNTSELSNLGFLGHGQFARPEPPTPNPVRVNKTLPNFSPSRFWPFWETSNSGTISASQAVRPEDSKASTTKIGAYAYQITTFFFDKKFTNLSTHKLDKSDKPSPTMNFKEVGGGRNEGTQTNTTKKGAYAYGTKTTI